MVELYKAAEQMAIRSDAKSEAEFSEQFSTLLADMIHHGEYEGDWEFQLRSWLPQYAEICRAFRGQQANVEAQTVFAAGNRWPAMKPRHVYEPLEIDATAA
jgi:hypothetical protein